VLAATFQFITDCAFVDIDWPDAESVVQSWQRRLLALDTGDYVLLPYWSAAGGSGKAAIPLCAHWFLGNLSARMMDDLQDQDKDNMPWSSWPPHQVLRVGLSLLFAAQRCLALVDADAVTIKDLQEQWATAGMLASKGQAPLNELHMPGYFESIASNTGLLFATACWGGARLHTDDLQVLQAMNQYGMAVGMLIQLGNDMQDIRSDLQHGNLTLAPIYALSRRDHALYPELQRLIDALRPNSSADIERIISICRDVGAFRFSFSVASQYQQQALDALSPPNLSHIDPFISFARCFLPTDYET